MAAGEDDNGFSVFLFGKSGFSRGVFSHINFNCSLPGQGGYTEEHVFVGSFRQCLRGSGGILAVLCWTRTVRSLGS